MTMNNQPSVCAGFTPESKSFPANIGKYAVWMPILFLLLTLLRNPTLYYMPGKAYNIDFFTMGGLALAAFAFLFFDFRRLAGTLIGMEKIPLAALFVFFGIAAGHFLMNSRLSIQHFGASLVWIAVPLLVCAYYDSFLKLLPAYFSFLCLFNLFYSFIEVLMNHQFIFGISGNINWNVSLIVMTTPFLLYFLWDWLRNRWKLPKIIPFLAGGVVLAVSAVLYVVLDSRAGFLALPAVLLVFGWLKLSARFRRIALFAGIGLFLAGSVTLSLFFTDSLGHVIAEDDRLILYEGAMNLIADHPVFGVGDGAFEEKYLQYRPLEYFFTKNTAQRSDHPHNHFLYIGSCFGIVGLCALLCLLLIPMGRVFMKLYRRESVSVLCHLCFFALLYTLIHASLDLVFFVWPNALVSLLILGLFWHECFVKETKEFSAGIWIRSASVFLAALIAGWSVFAAVRSCWCSYNVMDLMVRRMPVSEMASKIYHTARMGPAEYAQNYAMLYLCENILNYPELSVYLADVMRRSNIENYPGVYMGRGNALFQLGRLQEAFDSYKREAESFPLALAPVNNMIMTAEKMGNRELVRKLEENMAFRMSARKINPQMFQEMIKSPDFDLRPWKIPKERGGPGGYYGIQK